MIDLNDIFNTFNNLEDSNSDKETDELSLLIDFSDHPLFWIGGFVKTINNHIFFKQFAIKNFNKIAPELDLVEVEKAGESIMFIKGWNYIKSININNHFHMDCIKVKASQSLMNALNESIIYFESLEDYDKCAFLDNIRVKVKDFLS